MLHIFQTVNNPISQEKLFFSKQNMTIYTEKEVRDKYGQKALDILNGEGSVNVTVNATPLSDKFKKDEGTPTRDKHRNGRSRR